MFWKFLGWDWGTLAILQQNHPFVWLWFWFEKVGIGRPPPQLGQNPKLIQKLDLKAPLRPKLKKNAFRFFQLLT